MKDRITTIFFDLDHTLWDFDRNSGITLEELHADYGIVKTVESAELFVKIYKQFNSHYWNLYRKDEVDKATLRTIRFEKTLEHFGIYDKALVDELAVEYLERCPDKPHVFPNCRETLDYLKPKYDLHIITNGFEEVQHRKMTNSGLTDFFEHVVNSEMAGKRKPHPSIFEFALNLAGAKPETSLMIGDNLEVDVEGATNLGWEAILFDPVKHNQDYSGHRIEDLAELQQIL